VAALVGDTVELEDITVEDPVPALVEVVIIEELLCALPLAMNLPPQTPVFALGGPTEDFI